MNPAIPCANCEKLHSEHTDEEVCLWAPGKFVPMNDEQLYRYIDGVASRVMGDQKRPADVLDYMAHLRAAV